MKKTIILTAAALLLAGGAGAQGGASLDWYGFVRNYAVYDTHDSSCGTEGLYYYMPNDNTLPGSSNFVALTSRLGLDVKGYEFEGIRMTARMEADFYAKSGTTAVLRLRQAYVSATKGRSTWKIGQAWHPMSADLPDIFSLESGAPFGPFARNPLVSYEFNAGAGFSFNLAALWQMQYTSTGPDGASADYIKRGGIPEMFLGVNFKSGAFSSKIGADFLSIVPENVKSGRLNTLNYFFYGQYSGEYWTLKAKATYANDGSHMNMVGGYGISARNADGTVSYTATRNLSGWMTLMFKGGGRLIPQILIGGTRMLGTPVAVTGGFYKKNNADNVGAMVRVQPELVYRLGKLDLGIEYMYTDVLYGEADRYVKVSDRLHWVNNHRIQAMVKYSF